ncbi:MAG TPA: hypothetical protein VLH79_03705 [Chthonomonadales bacterium]|nr:hypothetical protein [Chthonomonadales bacterium]
MSTDELFSLFRNPGPAFRGKPFWSWNGALDRDELLRQIGVLHRMGMGGFFMHSRTGLVTEYLGDEWFDLINACADEGERLGLESWLYDEDRWPSGTAGGIVTRDPRYRMRYLHMATVDAAAFTWPPDAVAVFAARRDGLAVHGARLLAPGDGLEGSLHALVFTVREMAPSSFYNGATYVDTMNPEATARYIEVTHERYRERCGDRLGRSIKGIFTDEPHRGALMDPFGGAGPDGEHMAPWTAALPHRFHEAFGYDLLERLPELFLQPEGRPVSQVKWHFTEMLQRLFLEGFMQPMDRWCRDHGIILTGHVLHEDSLAAQTSMCGSMMRCYEHMEYPGIDLLTEGNRAYWVAKQLQSAARQLGRPWLLSELYGCTGWQMPFEGHKAVGDWQALFGINLRCHHLSWYTMEGEAKRDFPASIFHQSAWWTEYHHVETYFARIGALMSQGRPRCDTLVVSPVESVWCQVHPGWARFLGATAPAIQALERKYAELFHWLQGAQIDFDYGDEEMMGRLGEVVTGEAAALRIGEASYRTVVLGGMATVRSSTLRLLERFAAAGGSVVFAGEPPPCVDALPAPGAADLAARTARTPWEREAVVSACEASSPPCVRVTLTDGRRPESVFVQMREDGERLVAFALNVDRDSPVSGASVRVRGEMAVEEWDCLRGERRPTQAFVEDGWTRIPTDFPPAGERLWVLEPALGRAPQAPSRQRERSTAELAGPFAYTLAEPNVCVLDMAELRIGDGPWQPAREVLKVDRAVRDHFGLPHRGGEMLQPWYIRQQGVTPLGRVAVRFGFDVALPPAGPVELVIERPDRFDVRVNGTPLDVRGASPWWVDRCFRRFELPSGALAEGANSVELECTYDANMGLEAVYLLGGFGVAVRGSRSELTALPETLAVGDVTAQGLPFYSGAIRYAVGTPPRPGPGERIMVRTPAFSAACVVAAGGGERALIPWQPYEADVTAAATAGAPVELEVILTRRNTFGPLHQVPLDAAGYGPGNFLTEGSAYSEAYMLFPAGLLAAPSFATLATEG